ncbi:DUF3306 domain-containing protein [Methylocaldum sp.]|uniref:DUF3306 domain-containing protein n=1 Tax=Methylocaldum sp. TaxID=1969727 RepID=UPI002D622A55|nr:DUF3306 domain-containing protein [Methylocaldum sp.]HYE36003.1 DUF3306 domain-containing protein [Methylocaldum sp.]
MTAKTELTRKFAEMQKHDSFFKRWARNKLNAKENNELAGPPKVVHDGLTESSENGSFDPQALHELFRQPEFSVRDGLDDYDGDYTAFEPRGELMTSDMRWALERAQAPSSNAADTGSPESSATPVMAYNAPDSGAETESSS